MCRIEERTGNRPVLPVCQSPYTPAYLVLCDRESCKKPWETTCHSAAVLPEAGQADGSSHHSPCDTARWGALP